MWKRLLRGILLAAVSSIELGDEDIDRIAKKLRVSEEFVVTLFEALKMELITQIQNGRII